MCQNGFLVVFFFIKLVAITLANKYASCLLVFAPSQPSRALHSCHINSCTKKYKAALLAGWHDAGWSVGGIVRNVRQGWNTSCIPNCSTRTRSTKSGIEMVMQSEASSALFCCHTHTLIYYSPTGPATPAQDKIGRHIFMTLLGIEEQRNFRGGNSCITISWTVVV